MPARGPRRVLCVVVVTMCACGTGEGCAPPATSPAKCAMSTMKSAPTLSAICAHAGEIDDPRICAATANNQLRMLALGDLLEFVVVDRFGVLGHAVRDDLDTSCRRSSGDGRA